MRSNHCPIKFLLNAVDATEAASAPQRIYPKRHQDALHSPNVAPNSVSHLPRINYHAPTKPAPIHPAFIPSFTGYGAVPHPPRNHHYSTMYPQGSGEVGPVHGHASQHNGMVDAATSPHSIMAAPYHGNVPPSEMAYHQANAPAHMMQPQQRHVTNQMMAEYNVAPNPVTSFATTYPMATHHVEGTYGRPSPQITVGSVQDPQPLPLPPIMPSMAVIPSAASGVTYIPRIPPDIIQKMVQNKSQYCVLQISVPPEDSSRRKGSRVFSMLERIILECNYAVNKFPVRVHLGILGGAMGKTKTKMRTWYNNRRAHDRMKKIEVKRNSTEEESSPVSPSSATHFQKEQPILLPTHVFAYQPIPEPFSFCTEQLEGILTSLGCTLEALPTMHPVKPSLIHWVHEKGNGVDAQVSTPSPQVIAANKVQTSPLRIRSGKLMLGSVQICGELGEDTSQDKGLEVKFLFGKKRIVYEWYAGEDFSNANETGGPYARVDAAFSDVTSLKLNPSNKFATLCLSFATDPTLSMQTAESMAKFKARAQQRQYERVMQEDFPVFVGKENHRIWMSRDEAEKVAKIIIDESAYLRNTGRGIQEPSTPVS